MRLFEKTFRHVDKRGPAKNKLHKWIRTWIIFFPLIAVDLGYVSIKMKGEIENDPWWDELTDRLFCAGYTKTVKDLFEMESELKKIFNETA